VHRVNSPPCAPCQGKLRRETGFPLVFRDAEGRQLAEWPRVPVAKHRGKVQPARRSLGGHRLTGVASRYSDRFQGRRTANGERYDKRSYTAAHRTLPFGTQVKVTNKRNRRSVIVRINDRGPYVKGRVLDLSDIAAREIGFHRVGLAQVSAVVVDSPG
jgi:rare lipoprotein A